MKKLAPRKASSTRRVQPSSFSDNITYVKQVLKAKADRSKPQESGRQQTTSTTAALENKISKLYAAMQKQAELSDQKIEEARQDSDTTKRELASTREYLAKKEAYDEAKAKQASAPTQTDDDNEDLAKAQAEKEEDAKLTDYKDEDLDGVDDNKAAQFDTSFDDFMSGVATSAPINTPVAAPAPAEPAKAEAVTAVKTPKKLDIGQVVKLGSDNNIKITNLFGIRSGANAVPGREGKHSKGVDYVGYSADGTSNVPVVVANGTIVNIGLDGDGTTIKPTQGAALGYYADVKVDTEDGAKIFRYGHLGPSIYSNKDKLLNTVVQKGAALYPKPAEGYVSTGSVTGPHVKLQVSSLDGDKLVRDFEKNDPSDYL
jgi:hypothetical protein